MVAGIRSLISRVGYNDAVLFVSIVYSSFDVLCKWGDYHACSKPIQWQLILSYMFVLIFRLSHFLGQHHAEEGEDFLLNFRHTKPIPRLLVTMTWAFTLPMFALWTALGTFWLYDIFHKTPECLPLGTQPWFLVFWQVLSYLWIVVHMVFCGIACDYERRIRLAESDVRDLMLEDDGDILTRWGRMTDFGSYGAVPWLKQRGLSATEVKKLPCSTHRGGAIECSICLNDINEGDSERKLTRCGHTFHKSCIDLWVLRCADCPLCKTDVKGVESPSLGVVV